MNTSCNMIDQNLTTNDAIHNITPLKIKEILLSPLTEHLTLSTHYSKIPNWKFIRDLKFDFKDSSFKSNLRKITIEGNPSKQQMCIGDLLLGLNPLFSRLLDLRDLSISSYTFGEFKATDCDQLRVNELKLIECTFNDNYLTNNVLQVIKNVSIVSLIKTTMPLQMIPLFLDLIWIKFNNCDFLNDDRLIEIFDVCPKVKVNKSTFQLFWLLNNYYFYIF